MNRLVAGMIAALAAFPFLLMLTRSSPRAWSYVLSPASEVGRALATSISIGLAIAILAVMLALPAARVLALAQFRGKTAVVFVIFLPLIAPPVASVLGLHRMLLLLRLTDNVAGVALAHLVPAVSYATLTLAGSFLRLDVDIESQARTLGASPLAVWRHVTIPAVLPGLAVAFCLAFLISWSQYLSTLIIGGGNVITVPIELVAFQRGGDEAISAALALVFLAPALVLALVSGKYVRR